MVISVDVLNDFVCFYQWLYEDNLLQCPMRGNNMITPARATVMTDLKKRVQGLIHMDSVIKGVEEKFGTQESSIEQRLKWAAGANPALNPVLQNFEQTLAARKKLLAVSLNYELLLLFEVMVTLEIKTIVFTLASQQGCR